jgi:2-keto-4-pentenoate hydratase/2-oxohepta-3-ene-1,7-dioic acid hydratase in catechol pathway
VKLATYRRDGAAGVGVVEAESGRLFHLAAAARRDCVAETPFASMLALIDADDDGLDLVRSLLAKRGGEADLWSQVGDVELLAPLPEPRQMRDAMSFALHIRQAARGARAAQALRSTGRDAFDAVLREPLEDLPAIYRQLPIYYLTNRLTVVGPGATVKWPRYSEVMDYELEIGIVTRRTAANIAAKEAQKHIFGYTIFNDFSARDRQAMEMQGRLGPAKGKSFDGSNAVGPWIVNPDELGDPQTLNVEVRVNGETRGKGDTSEMLFSFEEIIAYASQDETIHAGEFFGSGTVGNCCGLEIGRFLESGDTIELHVDQIGALTNRVLRQDAARA